MQPATRLRSLLPALLLALLFPWPCGAPCALDADCDDGDPCTAAEGAAADRCGTDGSCDPSFLQPEGGLPGCE